jgi:hypothetical protein
MKELKYFDHKQNFTTKKYELKKELGQSLMEFSISLIIFFILLAGIVDLGRMFFTYMALRDAAQEGAAYGSVNPMMVGDIINRVRGVSKLPVNFSQDINEPEVIIIKHQEFPCAGNEIIVTVETNYLLTMPLIGTILGRQSIPISATATDHILRPPCSGD